MDWPMAGSDPGGGGDPGGHRTPLLYTNVDLFGFHLGLKRENGNSFWGGGREGDVRGSQKLGGSSASYKLSTTKDSQYICSFPIP